MKSLNWISIQFTHVSNSWYQGHLTITLVCLAYCVCSACVLQRQDVSCIGIWCKVAEWHHFSRVLLGEYRIFIFNMFATFTDFLCTVIIIVYYANGSHYKTYIQLIEKIKTQKHTHIIHRIIIQIKDYSSDSTKNCCVHKVLPYFTILMCTQNRKRQYHIIITSTDPP